MTLPRAIRITSLEALAARHGDLSRAVLVGLDLGDTCDARIVHHTVLLGCSLSERLASALRGRGALVIPRLDGFPYNPMRSTLYSPEELLAGYDGTLESSHDFQIFAHFRDSGRFAPDVYEALAQRLHDFAIDEALREVVGPAKKRLVAVMGGHAKTRGSADYARVARLTWTLGRRGFTVASGGGPGIMEAANLGAYLSRWDNDGAVDEALAILGRAPAYSNGAAFLPAYVDAAREVSRRFPDGAMSLAIPTWFYGHEPSNLFGRHIAKYFSNGLREDTLLAIAHAGVVFAAGSAGTTQEIFMDAAQNHYETFGAPSPMVFLGRDRYEKETNLFSTLQTCAKGRPYERMLLLSDDVTEIADFLEANTGD
jgi:predicted Rossmann-fold nucleotide-binding protein